MSRVLILLTFFIGLNSFAGWKGKFERIIAEDLIHSTEEITYNLESLDGDANYQLYLDDPNSVRHLNTGDIIEVDGQLLGKVNSGGDSRESILVQNIKAVEYSPRMESFAAFQEFKRNALFVVVNFSDQNSFTTKSGALSLFSKVKTTYLNSSYNQINYQYSSRDVVEVTIDQKVGQGCDPYGWRIQVADKLSSEGVLYQNYNHLVMFFLTKNIWDAFGQVLVPSEA